MKFTPEPYQETMLEWADPRHIFAYFVSPGMGKTGVSLSVIDNLITSGRSKGVFLIAPLRVCKITWPEESRKWDHSSWLKVVSLRTPEGLQAWEDGSADVYLINREMLASYAIRRKDKKPTRRIGMMEKLFKGRKTLPVDTFLWDELSQCKDPSSKSFKSVKPFLDMFTQRIGLTGTPVPNNYLDLYGQVYLLDLGARLGETFTEYKRRYFTSDYMGYSWELKAGAKEEIDKRLSDICLSLSSEDHMVLPTCSHIEIACPLGKGAKDYKEMQKELLLELERTDVVATNAAVLVGKLLQITGGAVYDEDRNVHVIHDEKIKALKKLRKKHGKEPMLILTAFRHEMDRVLEAIPGAEKFDEDRLDDWRSGKIQTWVSNPKSLSHGIDGLQKGGRIAVWYTPTHSQEEFVQTNARLVRKGQTCETLIYMLVCKDTVDEAAIEALRSKEATQSGLLKTLKNIQTLAKP